MNDILSVRRSEEKLIHIHHLLSVKKKRMNEEKTNEKKNHKNHLAHEEYGCS